MENSNITIEKVALKYGLYTFGGLVVYFLIMYFSGFAHIIELRNLNLFIIVPGIWFALNHFKENSNSHLNYFEGISVGTLTGAIAAIPFSVFMFFFMIYNVDFMMKIRESVPFAQYVNPYIIAFIVTFEGFISGMMTSFVLMQYLKKKYISSTA